MLITAATINDLQCLITRLKADQAKKISYGIDCSIDIDRMKKAAQCLWILSQDISECDIEQSSFYCCTEILKELPNFDCSIKEDCSDTKTIDCSVIQIIEDDKEVGGKCPPYGIVINELP